MARGPSAQMATPARLSSQRKVRPTGVPQGEPGGQRPPAFSIHSPGRREMVARPKVFEKGRKSPGITFD